MPNSIHFYWKQIFLNLINKLKKRKFGATSCWKKNIWKSYKSRRSRSQVFYTIVIPEILAKLTGKYGSLILIKNQTFTLQLHWKRIFNFGKFLRMYFYRTLRLLLPVTLTFIFCAQTENPSNAERSSRANNCKP